jgi:hypothetical protein
MILLQALPHVERERQYVPDHDGDHGEYVLVWCAVMFVFYVVVGAVVVEFLL